MWKTIVAVIFLLPTIAFAQTSDAELIKRLVPVLQQQRNTALDSVAVAESRLVAMTEELAKANEKIKSLEEQLKPKETKK